MIIMATIAQLEELLTNNQAVAGSNPAGGPAGTPAGSDGGMVDAKGMERWLMKTCESDRPIFRRGSHRAGSNPARYSIFNKGEFMKKNDKLWSCGDEERLIHETPDEAIEAFIDDCHPDDIEDIGEVTAYEFKRMDASGYLDAENIVRDCLDQLDEDLADPDGNNTMEPTKTMISAAEKMIKVIESEYVSWAMEETGESVTVDAYEWVKENRSDWLE